ncbi:MAG: sigma-70 family RNA polymerase sigma factor [candidate division WOR-3 bacterium]
MALIAYNTVSDQEKARTRPPYVREQEDRLLVSQCLSEDPAVRNKAQKDLFNRFNTGIIYLAFLRLGSRPEAEDCASEALRDVLVQLERFQWRCTLSTWIYTIARHWINKYARKARLDITDTDLDKLDDPALVPALGRSPPVLLEGREAWLNLVAEIYRLPDRYRDACHLRFADEMRIEEIAQVMDTTIDSVKKLITRGRKVLTARLGMYRDRNDA